MKPDKKMAGSNVPGAVAGKDPWLDAPKVAPTPLVAPSDPGDVVAAPNKVTVS